LISKELESRAPVSPLFLPEFAPIAEATDLDKPGEQRQQAKRGSISLNWTTKLNARNVGLS